MPGRPASAALLVAVAALLVPGPARGGSDPADRWSTISTPHFNVHYPQGGRAMASRAAVVAEEAYERCAAFLGFRPSEVVEVVIVDDTDASNGFTSVYPYDHVKLLAAPPGPDSELASYDDWLRVLFYHEYAHVLHMDQVEGLPRVVNRVLGKTILPNGATNPWFVEGFATFVETRLTGGGRVGSSLFEMMLRSAALDGTFADLDELTVSPLKLPRGGAPYLYGSYFVDFLFARGGIAPVVDFIRQYGGRLVPFAMNLVARRTLGADFPTLYGRFRAGVEARARAVADRVRAEGEVAGTPLTTDGEGKERPVFTPDSRAIRFVRGDGRSTGGVFQVGLDGRGLERLSDCHGGCDSLAPDGDGWMVVHAEPWRIYRSFGDVFRVAPGGRERRITTRARARDAWPLPGGEVLHVTAEFDQVSVVAREPATGAVRVVVPPGRFAGIGTPRPVPGTGRIVFSGNRGGRWDLWTAPLDGAGEPAPLTSDACLDRDPWPSPDGRWVVFASDRGGVFNLHALDLATGARRRATNVVSGAFWPAVSPDGRHLAFTTWSGRGSDLALLPFTPEAWPVADPAASCRGDGTAISPAVPAASAAVEPPSPPRAYDPRPSLVPRSLRPYGSFSTLQDSRLGLSIAGSDAVGRHAFDASVDTTLTAFRPAFAAAYSYGGTFPTLSLAVATWPGDASVARDGGVATVATRDVQLSGAATLPLPLRDRSLSLSLGYVAQWTWTGTTAGGAEPRNPVVHRRTGLTLTFQHDSTETYAYSISPEKGFRTGLTLTARHRWLGAEGRALTASAWFYEFVGLGRGHVLALLGSGTISVGDADTRDRVSVGGLPETNPLLDLLRPQPGTRALRGFAPGALSGDAGVLGNVEYRFPIAQVFRGLDTLPVAARRLWGRVFGDVGATWEGLRSVGGVGGSVGAELDLSVNLFLALDLVVRLGYAHGFGPGGGDQVFLLLTQ